LNLFRTDTDDEIFYNPEIGMFGQNDNLDGTTTRQGFELGFIWRLQTLRVNAIYTHTETNIGGGPYDGKEVPFVPTNRISANVHYTIGQRVELGVDGVYVGDHYLISDVYNAFDKADAYTVVNAKLKYHCGRFTFFADLNNIFDEAYAAYSGVHWSGEPGYYPSPDFNVLVGVTARFGQI
jgi:iron complex outermembrane receptor protein